MAGIFSFKCESCGKTHEGSPSFSFKTPSSWLEQSEEVIRANGKISDDLCFYEDEEGWHYFARVVIEIPIIGVSKPFLWGVWVSLSEESYEHYVETWNEPDTEKTYFGWLCNRFPYYENTYALAADVHPRPGGLRPFICLHKTTHELYNDFINGLSIEKAQTIAQVAQHG